MPAKPAPATWKVVLAFGLIYIIWGSTYLGIRFAIETIPPFFMIGIRYLIAGTILFVVARAAGAPLPRRLEWRSGFIIGGLLLLGGNGGVSFAEQKLPSGLAALLVATMPLWMSLIEWLRPGGTHPGRRAIVGLVIGFVGVMVLVGPAQILAGKGLDPLSTGVIILATISWATGSVYARTKHAHLPESPLMSTAVEMLGGSVLLMVVAALLGEVGAFKPQAVSTTSLLALGYLIVFGSLVAYTCYVWILRVSTPARASTYAYVNPVVAVLLGWLLANEKLTSEMLIATPLIVLAVILISTSPRREPAPVEDTTQVTVKPTPQVAGAEK